MVSQWYCMPCLQGCVLPALRIVLPQLLCTEALRAVAQQCPSCQSTPAAGAQAYKVQQMEEALSMLGAAGSAGPAKLAEELRDISLI